jgi:isopentenyl-diphosphate delta-isomerase
MEKVILVDRKDHKIGLMEKQEAHIKGLLHRAFSVFVFNKNNELLLQKRALHKYHSGGLWTNTCCSHPRENENTLEAANRRLKEEMGVSCKLEFKFNFIYKASLDNKLFEHEFDHVFFGFSDNLPQINKEEVDSFEYKPLNFITADIIRNPNKYTEWFKICLNEVVKNYEKL